MPLNYPTAYDLSDPFLSRFVSLTELKLRLAPSTPAILNEALSTYLSPLQDCVDFGVSSQHRKAAGEVPEDVALAD